MDLFDYINAAMQKSHCISERKFCELLKISPNSINSYRKGSWPTEKTMMKIARAAGADPWQALIDLNVWRAENDDIKQIYKGIADTIKKAALVLFTMSALYHPAPAHAAGLTDHLICKASSVFVYIM